MARELTERQAILNLQRYLRQLAFFDPSLPELPIDGVFDSETREAVEIFQRNNGMDVTGEADRATWDAVYEAYRQSIRVNHKPLAVDIFYRLPTSSDIRRQDTGFHVAAVQYMLNEILLFYGTRPELSTDGTYSEQTEDAVRLFQSNSGLPQTGNVDLETWNRLTALYNELFRGQNQ